jgi:hypothetical protein
MESSILKSVKKRLGIPDDYDVYDEDVLMNINSALSTITQLGVGPEVGFEVQDDSATWEQLLGGDFRLNQVRDYVTLKTRLVFDPPPTSFGISSIEKLLEEMAWRIEVAANPAPTAVGNIPDVIYPEI